VYGCSRISQAFMHDPYGMAYSDFPSGGSIHA
jgi:hypothetical protein